MDSQNKSCHQIDSIAPVKDYCEQRIIRNHSPYHALPFYVQLKRKFVLGVIKLFEAFLGNIIYIKNKQQELFFIDSRLQRILVELLEKKIIYGWDILQNYPDAPIVIRYGIYLRLFGPVTAKEYRVEGFGVGNDKNKALLVALAEAFERQSAYIWDRSLLIRGSQVQLESKYSLVVPNLFSDRQKKLDDAKNIKIDTEIDWVSAKNFFDNKDYLLPAQMTYVLHRNENPAEPIIIDSSTSGVAAGANYEHAACQAILELIERDALMGYWLNKITPLVIDQATITSDAAVKKIAEINSYKLELTILDITSDIRIPTLCAVLRDPALQIPVSMSAVTDFNKEIAIEKLLLEISKYAHYRTVKPGTATDSGSDAMVDTMIKRRMLWAQKDYYEKINFFIQGPLTSFATVEDTQQLTKYSEKLRYVKDVLKEKKYPVFLVDVTSKEAKVAGLRVVRAIAPDLIPIHFSEYRRHLGVSRVYDFPVLVGKSKMRSSEDNINNIPHPFL